MFKGTYCPEGQLVAAVRHALPACLQGACCRWAAVLTFCLRFCCSIVQEEQRELAKTIRVSGSILLSTVSNFLDFFKIGAWSSSLPDQACRMPWLDCVAQRWPAACDQSAQPSTPVSVLTPMPPPPPLCRGGQAAGHCAHAAGPARPGHRCALHHRGHGGPRGKPQTGTVQAGGLLLPLLLMPRCVVLLAGQSRLLWLLQTSSCGCSSSRPHQASPVPSHPPLPTLLTHPPHFTPTHPAAARCGAAAARL